MARLAGGSFSLLTVFVVHFCLGPVRSYVVREGSSYQLGEEKVTNLHFFLHDTVSGQNPTAVKVAAPAGNASPTLFGSVYVIDDPLTVGVDPASEVVGNAQGIYAFTGMDKFSLYMAVDFGFTTGEFNGSSISVASRNPFTDSSRDLAVVGGKGQFRLARGFAQLTTRSLKGLDIIVEYNVTVLHY